MTELKRDPKIREALKKDMAQCIATVMGVMAMPDAALAESIIDALEKKGWHGVKE